MSKKPLSDLRKTRLDDLFADLEPDPTPAGSDGGQILAGWTWEADSEGRYSSISPEVQAVLGVDPESFVGQKFSEFRLAPASVADLQESLKSAVYPLTVDVNFVSESGSNVQVGLHILSPRQNARGNGKARGLHGFVQTRFTQDNDFILELPGQEVLAQPSEEPAIETPPAEEPEEKSIEARPDTPLADAEPPASAAFDVKTTPSQPIAPDEAAALAGETRDAAPPAPPQETQPPALAAKPLESQPPSVKPTLPAAHDVPTTPIKRRDTATLPPDTGSFIANFRQSTERPTRPVAPSPIRPEPPSHPRPTPTPGGWQDFMVYRDDEVGMRSLPMGDALSMIGQESLQNGQPGVQNAGPSTPAVLALPAMMEGGAASLLLEILDEDPSRQWTAEERTLVEQVTDQLTLALENARLFQQNITLLEAVEQDRQRYSDLYNHAPDCYYSIDPEGVFIEFNQTGLSWIGYTRDEVVGRMRAIDIVAPYSRPLFTAQFPRLQREGRMENIEVDFLRKNGTTFPVLIDSTAQFDAEGRFLQSRTIARDITRLRQLEQRQRQLARAIEATADMVVITDRSGAILFANPATEQTSGYSRDEILGQNPRILKSGQQDKSFYEKMWSTILAGQVWRGEIINRRKNGSYYYAQLTISPITNERGENDQFVAVQRDITPQKRAEAEREKLLTETEILYTASAELNAARSYDDVLSTLRRYTLVGVGSHHVVMGVFDHAWTSGRPPQQVEIAARWTNKTGISFDQMYPLHAFPSAGRLLRPDSVLVVEDIKTDTRIDESVRSLYVNQIGATSALFAPIVVSGSWLGFINANYPQRTRFPEADIRRLMVLASQAAVAFQNIHLLDEARVRNDELSTLNTIISTASRSLDVETMLHEILDQLMAIIDYQAGLISVADTITNKLRLVAHRNLPEALSRRLNTAGLEGTLCEIVYRRGEILQIANFHEVSPVDVSSLIAMGLRSYLGIPLESKGRVLGTVCVFGEHAQSGAPANLSLLQSIGQQVGVAIENALLFEQTQAALSVTETLYQASAQLNAAQSYAEIMSALRQHTVLGRSGDPVVALVSFDHPWTEENLPEHMDILSLWSQDSSQITTPRRMPLESFQWLVDNFKSDTPLFIEDASVYPALDAYSRSWAQRSGFKSAILVPLVVGGQWGGFIGGFYQQASQFPEADRRSLMSMAGQAAVAVQNLQSIELAKSRAQEAQRRSEELSLVNSIISAVASSLDLQSSLDIIASRLGQELRTQTGIALLNEERNVLTIVSSFSPESGMFDVLGIDLPLEGNPSSQEVIRTRKTLIVEDAQENALTAPIHDIMRQRGVETLMIIPMLTGNRIIGTVGLDILEKGRHFQPDEIALAETIVLQAATAIQNARLFEQTELALEETETLYKASAEFNTAETFDEILNVIRRYTVLGSGTRNVTLALFDHAWTANAPAEWLLTTARWALSPSDELPGPRYSLANLASARQFFKAETIVTVENPSKDERLDLSARQLFLDYFEAASLLFAPIVVGGEWIGHLIGIYVEPTRFQENSLRRLSTLIGQAAVAVQNIRLLQESRRRAEQLQTAAIIARDASGTLALDTLLSRAVQLICEGFEYYHASIFLLDSEGNAVVRASIGQAGEEMVRRKHSLAVGSRSVIGHVTRNGTSLVSNDVLQDAIHRPNPLLPNTRSECGIPLKLADKVIGALDVQSIEVNAFKPEDISVLQILADQIAVAVDNARAYELSQEAVGEMKRADQLKSQFLANISHELRTPLNSIIGFSRVILKGIDGPVSDLQQQDLTAIYNSGQHLLNLINDILDLSKIEAGKMELSFEDNVNIADIINSVMPTMVGLIKDRPIQLNKEIAPDLPLVRADPLKVRQILINLLSNAAKFTEKGTVTLRANAVAGSHGMPEVRIEVQDSGPGIASQDHAKLFLPFSQVDGSATRKTGGSGLGLSICRHLVEMHGGQIGLTSTLGTGSTFYFTLPMQPLRKLTGSLGLPPDAPLILAIDDERQIVHLYERYLHGHGYRVIGVNDPTQAAAAARQHHPAAITLDVMMPGRDGWQVLAELKSDPDTRDIPVIMCTILEEQGKGFSMGATDYLMKPILEDDLVQALNRINKNGESREIMLIDIDPTDRRLVQRVLMDHPEYRLVLIESGAKALTHIRARQPHAILLDLDMPDLDGFTLLETLRADPILVDIPVIILADGNLPEEQHTRLSLISQALLTKGLISEDELFITLESSLKRYS